MAIEICTSFAPTDEMFIIKLYRHTIPMPRSSRIYARTRAWAHHELRILLMFALRLLVWLSFEVLQVIYRK